MFFLGPIFHLCSGQNFSKFNFLLNLTSDFSKSSFLLILGAQFVEVQISCLTFQNSCLMQEIKQEISQKLQEN